MMIKFLPHGKGIAFKAMQYLLAKHDHLGQVRADVQTLRGNGELFASIADSCGFSQRYTSAVIAFAPTDAPTDADIEEVLDSFERLAFAGLKKEDYHLFAVLHEDDDGSKHIHVLTPRVHLGTQKSLNIAPPGHTSTFYPWRDHWNEKKGWASPKDPSRRRAVNAPQHELRLNLEALKQGLELESNPRDYIAFSIEAAVHTGVAVDRDGVERFLREQVFKDDYLGVVSRVTKNAISVRLRDEESGELSRPMRLTGAFFDHDFNADKWLALQEKTKKEESLIQPKEPDLTLLKELEQAIEAKKEQRKRYNERHYKTKPVEPVAQTNEPIILEVHYEQSITTAIEKKPRATDQLAAAIRDAEQRQLQLISAIRSIEPAIRDAEQKQLQLTSAIRELEIYKERTNAEVRDRRLSNQSIQQQIDRATAQIYSLGAEVAALEQWVLDQEDDEVDYQPNRPRPRG